MGSLPAVVLDASALLDYLLQQRQAKQIARVIFNDSTTLHAPVLVDSEVLSAVRRMELAGGLDSARVEEVRQFARSLPIELHSLRPYYDRAWSLRHRVTVSDAFYVSLAEALDAPLLTTDKRLARTAAELPEVDVLAIDG